MLRTEIRRLMSPDRDDYRLAMLMRLDPEKLAAVRRAISKKTKCPQCDELNSADQRSCQKCGAALYPDLEEKRRRKEEKARRH